MSSGSSRTGPSPRLKCGLKKRLSIGQKSWTKGRRKASKRAIGGTNGPPNALVTPTSSLNRSSISASGQCAAWPFPESRKAAGKYGFGELSCPVSPRHRRVAPYATSQSPNQSATIAASVRFSQLAKPPLIAGPRSVPLSVR